eukprot:scaffold4326_cov60-Phaeocystis_antarctica.AAC.1
MRGTWRNGQQLGEGSTRGRCRRSARRSVSCPPAPRRAKLAASLLRHVQPSRAARSTYTARSRAMSRHHSAAVAGTPQRHHLLRSTAGESPRTSQWRSDLRHAARAPP